MIVRYPNDVDREFVATNFRREYNSSATINDRGNKYANTVCNVKLTATHASKWSPAVREAAAVTTAAVWLPVRNEVRFTTGYVVRVCCPIMLVNRCEIAGYIPA